MFNSNLNRTILFLLMLFFAVSNISAKGTYNTDSDSTITSKVEVPEKKNNKDNDVWFAKVKDPASGKKYWITFETMKNLDIERKKGLKILKTRKNKGKFWKKVADVLETVVDVTTNEFIDWLIDKLFNKEEPNKNEREEEEKN